MKITKDFVTYELTNEEVAILLEAGKILAVIKNIRPKFPAFYDAVSGEVLDMSHVVDTIQSVMDCSGHSLQLLDEEFWNKT